MAVNKHPQGLSLFVTRCVFRLGLSRPVGCITQGPSWVHGQSRLTRQWRRQGCFGCSSTPFMPEARGLGYCYILPGDSADLEHLVISRFSSIFANIQVARARAPEIKRCGFRPKFRGTNTRHPLPLNPVYATVRYFITLMTNGP